MKSNQKTLMSALFALGLVAAPVPTTSFATVAHIPTNDIAKSPLLNFYSSEKLPVIKVVSAAKTTTIVRRIDSGRAECGSLPKEYRADCFSKALTRASKVVRAPDYSSANRALSSGGRKLGGIVSRNVDKAKPKLKGRNGTYRAVKKAAVSKVNKQARAIVSETATKLIRSSGKSAKLRPHYQRIAKAVNSSKRIFRS